ncbi:MAG: sigma 54-interacting transcriptional regulator [Thermoguttaceae bacterium]
MGNVCLNIIECGVMRHLLKAAPEDVVRIGRAPDNDIILSDGKCSRYHATISCRDKRTWFFRDLGSSNGSIVNGFLISAGEFDLLDGDRIRVGQTVLIFAYGDTLPVRRIRTTDAPPAIVESGSGVFGVSAAADLPEPVVDPNEQTIIQKQRAESLFLPNRSQNGSRAPVLTRSGYGSAELCQLAFSLGATESIEGVGRQTISGLINATQAESGGLWLVAYQVNSMRELRPSRLRLVVEHAAAGQTYRQLSEPLAKIALREQQGLLLSEGESAETRRDNNVLVAPLRDGKQIIGFLHLNAYQQSEGFDDIDLDYAVAVSEAVASAIKTIHRTQVLAVSLQQARQDASMLRGMLQDDTSIVGQSDPIRQIQLQIRQAAEGKATVLVTGESGVGKELIARAVHCASPRRDKPFVCFNCAAISETLLESELFGHEKGAFTGAHERKIGKFEMANSGTLFLDEIGEMSQMLQAKFLRVLEGHPFDRVGGTKSVSVDVRVVAATNRNLEIEVAEGRFRRDLFFRLRVLEIFMPPLRERPGDIVILSDYFLERFCRETGRRYTGFTPEARHALESHRWPGNVRELKNVIERAVVVGTQPLIRAQDLLLSTLDMPSHQTPPAEPVAFDTDKSLDEIEAIYIAQVLNATEWNKSLTAKKLGIERTTLDRKIRRYNLDKEV